MTCSKWNSKVDAETCIVRVCECVPDGGDAASIVASGMNHIVPDGEDANINDVAFVSKPMAVCCMSQLKEDSEEHVDPCDVGVTTQVIMRRAHAARKLLDAELTWKSTQLWLRNLLREGVAPEAIAACRYVKSKSRIVLE